MVMLNFDLGLNEEFQPISLEPVFFLVTSLF